MNIEIIGAESLGVRGICCFVKTGNRNILIDPGIALGYVRHKLLPHPVQIAVDEKAQKRIIDVWSESTDIVLSHLHGDHVPLADANPYQLDINRLIGLNTRASVWAKDPSHFSPTCCCFARRFDFSRRKKRRPHDFFRSSTTRREKRCL